MELFKGVDTAQKITSAQAAKLKAENLSFVCRYLVPTSGDTAWKALTKEEAETLQANNMAIALLWETTAARARKGADAGATDGMVARNLAIAMRVPTDCAIYFCVDYDADRSDYQLIESYLYAAKNACSPYRCGVYGKADLVNSVKADCYMQCVAWSNGIVSDKTDIYQYQWQGGAEAQKIKKRTGVTVDMDRCEDLSAAGVWIPKSKTAHEWCVENGLVDDTMRDVSQIEEIIYRYHKMNVG